MPDFPAEIEDEFQELLFALENSERGGWFFAVYQQWKVAEELIARLRQATQLPIFSWQYQPEAPTYPVDYLKTLTAEQQAQRAIILFNQVASGGEKVIKSLDFNRERFADYPHSLLFWVTESELKQIAIGAGHFWAQRGGRFDFSQVFMLEAENTTPYLSINWAGLLVHVKNYQEAKQQLHFYLTQLAQQKNEVGSLALAELYDKIAYSLSFLGKYQEAMPYAEKVLAIRKQVLGEEDLQSANSLSNLADLYYYQSSYFKALPLYQKALVIREEQLGENHPDVAKSLNNLANVYESQGCYEEALPLYERSLAIWEKILGKSHVDVANILNHLARLYKIQGDYTAALHLYGRALAIWEKTVDEYYPDVAVSLNNLAALYERQGNYTTALSLYQRTLVVLEKSFGIEHPTTKIVAKNYARLQAKIANFETDRE